MNKHGPLSDKTGLDVKIGLKSKPEDDKTRIDTYLTADLKSDELVRERINGNTTLSLASPVNLFYRLLELIPGEDADREGLVETPQRVADAWFTELLSGYMQDPADILKTFENDSASGGLVILKDIPVYSLCEHHILPIFGVAHIAYIPNGRVLGLSKFKRLVDIYARRLQVQERLTTQIADALKEGLDAKGVMVIIKARHMCMEIRGVNTAGTITITSEIRGLFRDVPALREEAMALLESSK